MGPCGAHARAPTAATWSPVIGRYSWWQQRQENNSSVCAHVGCKGSQLLQVSPGLSVAQQLQSHNIKASHAPAPTTRQHQTHTCGSSSLTTVLCCLMYSPRALYSPGGYSLSAAKAAANRASCCPCRRLLSFRGQRCSRCVAVCVKHQACCKQFHRQAGMGVCVIGGGMATREDRWQVMREVGSGADRADGC